MELVEIERIIIPEWGHKIHDEQTFRKLVGVIRDFGSLKNIVVREVGECFEVIEGRRCFLAMKELEHPFVIVKNMGIISDLRAKEINLQLNDIYFRTDFVDLSEVIVDIKTEEGIKRATKLSVYDLDEVKALSNLKTFDWESLNKSSAHVSKNTLFT